MEGLQNKRDANPNAIADMIHEHFSSGGRFFRDNENKVYLLWHHHIFEIVNNQPFNALIKRKAGLLPTEHPRRATIGLDLSPGQTHVGSGENPLQQVFIGIG